MEKYSIQSKEYSNRFSEELLNLLNHSREIRVSRKEDDYSNSLDEIVNQQKCIGFKFSVFKGLFSTFSSAVTDCNLIITIFWYMHFKTLSPGAYVLFITYSFDLSSLAIYMSTLIVSLQSTKVYIQDFYKKIENKKRNRIVIDDSILSKIEYNSINVLVGKNGSGKSMSLEYINTQLPNSVMLPENYHLMDVSKKENICLNQVVDYDNSFLEDILNEHVGNENLSGGQQFRMVLMRTLLTDAKIILIDNNFMSVDSKLREKIFEYLKKSGKTIIFTNHLYRNEYKEFSVIEV
ncbi:ATP-binding cassette domain-containing protein [Holdemanella biformis]|uniref:ATP-binding cassette domain-containing protein n=1 Tax=Holdemanella biformis TaxID=1735 RepID=UPI00189C31F8|nr:ATP-binding cassette domain-containing protein [Holdemanella biformis]